MLVKLEDVHIYRYKMCKFSHIYLPPEVQIRYYYFSNEHRAEEDTGGGR